MGVAWSWGDHISFPLKDPHPETVVFSVYEDRDTLQVGEDILIGSATMKIPSVKMNTDVSSILISFFNFINYILNFGRNIVVQSVK